MKDNLIMNIRVDQVENIGIERGIGEDRAYSFSDNENLGKR